MFDIFTRGMVGIYQHCGEQHLQRYLDELTFRRNNRSKLGAGDQRRARLAAHGLNEKRLTYWGLKRARAPRQLTRASLMEGTPGIARTFRAETQGRVMDLGQ
jgi:ISXO2 transposase-like protein